MTLQANEWTDKAKFIGPSDRAGGQKKRETWFDAFDVGYPASRGHTITEE